MIADPAVLCATGRADSAPIGERYFTSLLIDAHLPDSQYSLQFVCTYLSNGGRAIARGLTELAARAGVSRSTASVNLRGLVDKGFLRELRPVGGKPSRKVCCPRGGANIRLSSFQMTTVAGALAAQRIGGFEIRLLLWLVYNIAEDGPNGIVGFRRAEIAKRLGVARRRVSAGVRALEREGLLRVHRGKRRRWTLTPVAAIPSNHPKPAAVLRAARVAREVAGHDRAPAEAIEAASWASERRARRVTGSNTRRVTGSNTPPSVYRASSQVGDGIPARVESGSSRGSSLKALNFLGKRVPFIERLRSEHPDVAAEWEKRPSRRKRE